jgi:hypothetical protein
LQANIHAQRPVSRAAVDADGFGVDIGFPPILFLFVAPAVLQILVR